MAGLHADGVPDAPDAHSISGRAILSGSVVQIADVALDPDYGSPQAARIGFRSLLAVPIVRSGAPIGAICIYRPEAGPFPDKQVALLQTFADQAVIAIENVRLFNETKEALEQQTATADILRVIASSPTDVQPVFDAIVRSAGRLCDATFCSLTRFDGELLHQVAVHNFTPEALEVAGRRYPMPLTRQHGGGRAILDRAVCHIADVENDPEYDSSLARVIGFRSLLVVPMFREGSPIGAIAAGRGRGTPSPFSPKQIALLETFANQAIIAIENVRLFRELQTRNRELTETLEQQTATAEILGAISQAQADVQPVFEAIADSAMRLFGAWSVAVYRYEAELLRLVAARGGLPGSSETLREQFQAGRRPTGDFPRDRAVVSRVVQHVVDVETDPAWAPRYREHANLRGFRSVVAMPMLRREDVVGVISVTRKQVGGFASAEIALIQTFADQAVIAVENARLLSELQAKNADLTEAHAQVTESLEQQTATAEILRVIASSPTDLQPVMEAVAENAARVCGATDSASSVLEGEHLR